jgi:hypothetical protein
MKHGIAAGHRVLQGSLVADIDGDETLDATSASVEPAARGPFIADHQPHFVTGCEHSQRGVSADETGRTGAEDLHMRPPAPTS